MKTINVNDLAQIFGGVLTYTASQYPKLPTDLPPIIDPITGKPPIVIEDPAPQLPTM